MIKVYISLILNDTGGYHSSESTDEDSRKGSYEITTQDSGDSSDATSVGTNSQPGTVNSMTPGAAEAIATLKGEPSLSISMLKYDSTTYPTGAREKSSRPKGHVFLPESPPSSGDSTPSSSPQMQRKGCAPRFLSKSPKAGRGTQGQYDLSTAEAGQGDIPGYTEVDRAKTAKDEKRAKQSGKEWWLNRNFYQRTRMKKTDILLLSTWSYSSNLYGIDTLILM